LHDRHDVRDLRRGSGMLLPPGIGPSRRWPWRQKSSRHSCSPSPPQATAKQGRLMFENGTGPRPARSQPPFFRNRPMLEKFSQIAEAAATSASRRHFLGQLGKSALAATAAVSGLLVFRGEARAATVCGPSSIGYCRNRPVGSSCGSPRGPRGICVSAPVCTCRTCPSGQAWQSCSNGARICCRRGYVCAVRGGQPICRPTGRNRPRMRRKRFR
jgi:hypothetical protein